jgi:hypothetical protein
MLENGPLTEAEQFHLSLSDCTAAAVREGHGHQYEVDGGVATLAHVHVPALDTANERLESYVTVFGPLRYGDAVVMQPTPADNTQLDDAAEASALPAALVELLFSVGTERHQQAGPILRRLHAFSRSNEELAAIVKPLFERVIREGSTPMHILLTDVATDRPEIRRLQLRADRP